MLAGATGVDVVLLVIAADEGIKPQTREHFEITRMLGVKRGVIALTKSDLVDAERREYARMEAADFVRGTFLEGAPVVALSARTGEGLAELKRALSGAAAEVVEKDAARHFRLPVDRSFSVKGFGTVVTGTLVSGSVSTGDEVELLPPGKKLRVRGLQTGGKSVERSVAGQRTAVNLAGVEHAFVKRGMVLAAPGKFRATRRVDVRLELLSSAQGLKQRAKVHFHSGTVETVGEIYLHAGTELPAGTSALVQIRLQDEIVLVRGDRFIVRQFSPVVTIGGGVVLDPLARRLTRKDTDRAKFLEAMETDSREAMLLGMVARNVLGVPMEEIVARTGWLESEVRAAATKLAEAMAVKAVSNDPLILIVAARFGEVREKLRLRVEKFQQDNPLVPGIAREELRAGLGRRVRPETFRSALEELVQEKKLAVNGEVVTKPGTGITLKPEEEKALGQIEKAFAKAGLTVPSVKEVLAQLAIEPARAEKLLQILLREKTLVRVSPELLFHRAALELLPALLAKHKKQRGDRIGVPAFKELTGISRKYAIPLLEYLDRQRLTRRAGDERVIL